MSKPEAANFPSTHYEMSHDRELFHAPKYPQPPKDMYYKVPEIVPQVTEPPRPIFPWEATARKPTRVFLDEQPAVPEPAPKETSSSFNDEMSVSMNEVLPPRSPSSPSATEISDPWTTYSSKNAWDDYASIDQYVRALKKVQARRGQVQILSQTTHSPATASGSTTPTRGRRESLILTDFPTSVERPSLPVTPAPIHRTSYWGDERSEGANLPTAEGVPDQVDWVSWPKLAFVTLLTLGP